MQKAHLFAVDSDSLEYVPFVKPAGTASLLAAIIFLAIPAVAQSPNPGAMVMPSVAPIFIEGQGFSSVLGLVNELSVPLNATIQVYSLDGRLVASEIVNMAPYSLQQLSMESIFGGAVALQMGSIRVSADHTAGLLGVLSMTYSGSHSHTSYFEEELAMPSMEGSNVSRGVADDVGRGSQVTAIASLSSSSQTIKVACLPESGLATQSTFVLGPNQTRLMKPCSGDPSNAVLDPSDIGSEPPMNSANHLQTAAGIAVSSDGMPGGFATFGITPHRTDDEVFFTSVNFSDPRTRQSGSSVYVAIPAGPSPLLIEGTYSPVLSVTNFGTNAAAVTVNSASTVSGTSEQTTLATFSLASGATRSIRLDNIPPSPGLTNALVIQTNASPGDVLSKVVSRGGQQLPVVEMVDKDDHGSHNAGGHPWSIEPGVTSTLFLFNGEATPQKVNLRFGTPSGPWMRGLILGPMETRAISINELIGMKEKDDNGQVLSLNGPTGELGWQADSTRVSGRILQASTALGMARSFSCSQWFYACSFTLSPSPDLLLYLNSTGDISETPVWAVFTGFHPPTSCSCANTSSGNTTLFDSWQSGSTSIATITSGGTSSTSVWKGVGEGTTTSTFFGTNQFQGGGSLMCQAAQPAQVSAPTKVAYVGENAHGSAVCPAKQAGFSRQITLQIVDQSGQPAKVQNWTVSDIINVGTQNALGIASTQTGSISGVSGPWLDQYFDCSTVCPASTGSTDALQIWTGNSVFPLGSNSIVYKCNSITFDGH